MKLTITLSASEEANIRATIDYLRRNPQYIGVTAPPPGYGWHPEDPRFQPRNVLEEQTRERFEEIAAQFDDDYPARLHADKVLTPGEKGHDLVLEPGVVHLFPCAGEGNGGGSQEEGGVGIRGGALSLDPVTGRPPDRVSLKQLPVPGGRAVYPVPVLGGELLGIMIMGDVSRMCRVDIRL